MIASLLGDVAEGGLLAGLTAGAPAFGQNPFFTIEQVQEADGALAQVEEYGAGALDVLR